MLLRGAVAQCPERVLEVIDYLNYQRQRRHIRNPVRYLYEAISFESNLAIPQSSTPELPTGFGQWVDVAKAKGEVLAAMTIDSVHHILSAEQMWIPTEQAQHSGQFLTANEIMRVSAPSYGSLANEKSVVSALIPKTVRTIVST